MSKDRFRVQFFSLRDDLPNDRQLVWYNKDGNARKNAVPAQYIKQSRDKGYEWNVLGRFHILGENPDYPNEKSLWAPWVAPGQAKDIYLRLDHVGYDKHRLTVHPGNEVEVAMAQEWALQNNVNKHTRTLDYLIPDPTQRDAKVAATIVQWFGTAVGLCFINRVIRTCPEMGEYFFNSVGQRRDANMHKEHEDSKDKLLALMTFLSKKYPELLEAEPGTDDYMAAQLMSDLSRRWGFPHIELKGRTDED